MIPPIHPEPEPDYAALAAFRQALRGFTAFSEAAARHAGLTPRQHQTLLAIKGAPTPPSLGELTEALGVRSHSAVELIDRLERLGLAARRADPTDHRRALLVLTEPGEALLRRLSQAHARELAAIGPVLAGLLGRFGG